jgi:cell wall-associated NlpC family hydrolase
MSGHDPRLTPARADLAAAHLKGIVDAPAYAEGHAMVGRAGKTWIRRRPAPDAPVETELLFGEIFTVYDVADGFAWGQAALDGYVGYVVEADLAPAATPPRWRVTASSTFVYARADLKSPVQMTLPMNARVAAGEGPYAALPGGGFIYTRHLAPIEATADDFVTVAERFLGLPYLWGGRTPLGFDCSGLVQSALALAGTPAPRDTDMQEAALGTPVPLTPGLQGLQRGDLVFWKGHVGVMVDAVRLLHANAHHMTVAREPLAKTAARIAASGSQITSIRRL